MSIKQCDYETLLSEYSNREAAITLLKKYRPYLEMIPSMRRATESLISIPLPLARIRQKKAVIDGLSSYPQDEVTRIPCDLAILMCDPEWQIKMGVEIIIFIHRPQEDFSNLLSRWRQTQLYLDQEYEWLMPPKEEHMFSEGSQKIYPLFVIFEQTLPRIQRGLMGASLPFVLENMDYNSEEEQFEVLST